MGHPGAGGEWDTSLRNGLSSHHNQVPSGDLPYRSVSSSAPFHVGEEMGPALSVIECLSMCPSLLSVTAINPTAKGLEGERVSANFQLWSIIKRSQGRNLSTNRGVMLFTGVVSLAGSVRLSL